MFLLFVQKNCTFIIRSKKLDLQFYYFYKKDYEYEWRNKLLISCPIRLPKEVRVHVERLLPRLLRLLRSLSPRPRRPLRPSLSKVSLNPPFFFKKSIIEIVSKRYSIVFLSLLSSLFIFVFLFFFSSIPFFNFLVDFLFFPFLFSAYFVLAFIFFPFLANFFIHLFLYFISFLGESESLKTVSSRPHFISFLFIFYYYFFFSFFYFLLLFIFFLNHFLFRRI